MNLQDLHLGDAIGVFANSVTTRLNEAVTQVSGLSPFPIREAAKGLLISLRASNPYAPSYLEVLERAPAFLSDYAEEQRWPPVGQITTSHIEDYLTAFQGSQRWIGDNDYGGVPEPVRRLAP